MPSPFPGMNPYLEREGVWHGCHERLCVYYAEALTAQVRPDYFVEIDEHVYIHELDADERKLVGRPDNFLTSNPSFSKAPVPGSGTPALAPLYTRLPTLAIDEEHLSFLKIRDRKSRDVVTVIELLSPVNKGSGRHEYLAKRQHYQVAGVGFVEIDLLRAGRRPPFEDQPTCDYCIAVMRPGEAPRTGLWPLQLPDPLPEIPVPLREGHADAKLDLQTLLHRVYDVSGYEDYVYAEEPDPPLKSSEMEWARALIPRP